MIQSDISSHTRLGITITAARTCVLFNHTKMPASLVERIREAVHSAVFFRSIRASNRFECESDALLSLLREAELFLSPCKSTE